MQIRLLGALEARVDDHAVALGGTKPRAVLAMLGLDANRETPGRQIVRHLGESFIKAMTMAQQAAPGEPAELVAAECVVLAETKDHQNWELIGELARELSGQEAKANFDEPLQHRLASFREESVGPQAPFLVNLQVA